VEPAKSVVVSRVAYAGAHAGYANDTVIGIETPDGTMQLRLTSDVVVELLTALERLRVFRSTGHYGPDDSEPIVH